MNCWAESLRGRPVSSELFHQKPLAPMERQLVGASTGLEAAVHLLSSVAHESGLTLAQAQVPNGGENKINEHKTAPQLLRGIVLGRRPTTGDAMLCQRDLSQQIIDAHGHNLWFLKDNQPTLLNDNKAAFAASVEAAFPPLNSDESGNRCRTQPRPYIKAMVVVNAAP